MSKPTLPTGSTKTLQSRLAELASEIEQLGEQLDRETRAEVARRMGQLVAAKGVTPAMHRHPRAMPEEGEVLIREWLNTEERPVRWLAKRAGYTQQHMHEVLAGHRPITQPVADAIAKVTGLPSDVLMPASAAQGVA